MYHYIFVLYMYIFVYSLHIAIYYVYYFRTQLRSVSCNNRDDYPKYSANGGVARNLRQGPTGKVVLFDSGRRSFYRTGLNKSEINTKIGIFLTESAYAPYAPCMSTPLSATDVITYNNVDNINITNY